jgi:hypothetical protein
MRGHAQKSYTHSISMDPKDSLMAQKCRKGLVR